MKRRLFIIICLLQCLIVKSQSQYQCQYWFDQEPPQTVTVNFNSNMAQMELDAASLIEGIHVLYLQVKDTTGMWCAARNYLFYKIPEQINSVNPENVTYHCWFDEDFEHEQTGPFGTGQFLLDADGLENGIHILYVTLKGDGLNSTRSYMFYKMTEQINLTNPENVTYHCWFDEDFEHEQTGPFGTGQFLLDADGLESGIHVLYVALEGNGLNSTRSYMFYKMPEQINPMNPENITYHCWFDEDFAHEQTGSFGTGVIQLNTLLLGEGEHTVYILLESEALTTTQSYTFEKHFINGRDIITIIHPTMVAGVVSGAGRYDQGDTCTLIATANNELFNFINWTTDGNVVSDSTEYSFIVTEDATYEANFDWTNPASVDYISDGLIMYLDGIYNTRNGHDTTATVWEDLIGNYDLTVSNYSSYTWEDNHFIGLGNGGYLNTGKTWKYFNSLNDDITIEIVTYIDCDKTSPSYRGLAGWHSGSDGTHFQNDQGGSRMQTLGRLPVTEADDQIATVSYTRNNGSFLNGVWKTNSTHLNQGINSNYTAVFGNSIQYSRGWNDSIYCIRMYSRSLTPEEVAYNHNIDVERFGASSSSWFGIVATANPVNGGTISGAGTFEMGQLCTLTATANANYTFVNWTENGTPVSVDQTYSFTVTGYRSLVANFVQDQPNTYIVSAMVQPTGAGTVNGSGDYEVGSTCTLRATPAEGYFFLNWTKNGNVVSTSPIYSFTVTGNANYVAHFSLGLPELHVTGITHSDFMAGQQVTISWTVQNDGVASTPIGGTWNDYVWLASTVDLRINDPNDIHLATVDNLMALDPGESYTNSVTVTLPSDITGSQYIFVLTDMVDAFNISFPNNLPPDPYTPSITGNPYYYFTGQTHGTNAGGVIMETNDYDNFFYKSVQVIPAPAPDLIVTNITHPTDIISGTSMPLSFTVENQGVATAVGSWYDAVYLSQSSTFNLATAYHLGSYQHENGLPVGQSYTYSTNVDIPRECYDAYYVFVVTDVTNAVYESILEDNNIGCSTTPVNVTMSACPNLVVTSVTAPSEMSVNKSYDISFTVQNIGAGVATESGWNDAVYLSRDEIWDYGDIVIKVVRHNNGSPLVQDATYTCNTTVSIPGNISGVWYVVVKTDKDNEVFEFLDEYDNARHAENPSTILILELSVTELWVDEMVNPNVSTEVEWTVTNNGDGLALGVLTDLIAFDSQIVDTVRTNIHLESNESAVVTRMINVPCVGLSSGTISVTSNADFNIIDADSTNNVISNSVNVIAPDLLVEQTSISENGWSGEPIEVKYTVTNNGTASLNMIATDSIYISGNPNDFSNATLIYSYQRMLNLQTSGVENVDLSVNLPDGISGIYYICVFANENGEICEGDNANSNNIVSAVDVSLSPYPNLQVVSASIEVTPINIGASATISYSIQNTGDGAVNNRSWTDRFYVSPTPSYDENTAELIGEYRVTNSIDIGGTIQVTANIIVSIDISAGYYYLIAMVDADNEIYEYNGENDNTYIEAQYQFDIYPCDLQAMSISGLSEVDWGSSATFILHGKNSSDVSTLYSQWNDKLYLSADNLISGDDIEIGNLVHNGHLEPGQEYQATFNVSIPYGMEGECYLIGVVDSQFSNPDINPQNNFVAKTITVNAVPTPDLELTGISVLDDFVGGQPSRIVYTVTNIGEVAVQNKLWNDRFYLSDDDEYSNEDLQLKTNAKHLSLNVYESYTDTVEIVVPIQNGGDYYLITKANATQSFFEPDFNNNTLGTMVQVTIPLPGDLIVQNVLSEFEIVAGERLHVSWDVKNIGENTLHGSGLKTLVYMSQDTVFDVTDKLLGSVTNSIMLPPNATTSQEMTARISGVPEGEYNLIVMTNATRTFNESNFGNNTTVSNNPFNVTLRVLPFSVPLTDTLENNLANDYRLNVGEFIQETVRIHLHSADSLQGALNHIFVTHNSVGDNLNYDYSTIEQFTANPELYIPSTQLEYYGVNVIGSTPVGDEQSIMIQADVLPFDLRSISPTYGGNTGKVTIELTGSKFSLDMTVQLMNAEETIFADTVYFQSFYKAYATFDLTDKPVGLYSVIISSLCEGDAYLEDAFEIRRGEPERLSTNIIYPNSPRPNRNIIMMLEFGNTGNVDITAPVIRLTSVGGSWIALTSEGLANHETDMLIPLQIEGAPQGILRPGGYGIINIFCYTSRALVFTINRIQ